MAIQPLFLLYVHQNNIQIINMFSAVLKHFINSQKTKHAKYYQAESLRAHLDFLVRDSMGYLRDSKEKDLYNVGYSNIIWQVIATRDIKKFNAGYH
jgi:hypothetical protein